MLRVEELVAGYRSVPVLDGLSLSLAAGEVVALVGPNGAGKSTTLRTVSGLIKPRSGRILLDERALTGLAPASVVRAGVAHVPEGRRIFPGLTVAENLRMGAFVERSGARIDERLERVFALFPRLAERQRQVGTTLSGGEQQMLAIGRALMSGPRILLLDEPSMGLAPVLVQRLFDSLRQLRAEGLGILLVEQNASLALSLADRAYVLSQGRLEATGSAVELADSEAVRQAYLGALDTDSVPEGSGG